LSVLCLGLALGVNLTAFVFVNGILFRPLPLDSPDGLVMLHEVQRDVPGSDGPVSYRTYLDWKDRAGAGIKIGAARRDSFNVSDGGDTRRYAGALVSWDFFPVVGVRPALGRGFLEPDGRAGGSPVVVLSHPLWEERYGRDPGVIGRTITIDGTVRTVIGVMPESLLHPGIPSFLRAARLWIPIGPVDAGRPRTDRQVVVVARLGADDTLDAVRARFDVVARSLSAAYAGQDGWGVSVRPVRLTPSATTRAMLWLGMGAVTAVLLVACANVANLSLARVRERPGRRARTGPHPAWQHPGGRSGGDVRDPAGRRLALRTELSEPAPCRGWLRHITDPEPADRARRRRSRGRARCWDPSA
jgi:hypothetical protein